MSNLKAKLHKENGFTLIEMLIVVAIIAILIAIAIPMVNKALERAREATDAANERAAVGLAMVEYMGASKKAAETESGIGVDGGTAYYVISNNKGSLTKTDPGSGSAGFNYGKGHAGLGEDNRDLSGKGIKLTITDVSGGEVEATWQ